MAITNKLGVWGNEGQYGTDWYTVSEGRIVGFQANTINYASKMNQAFKNATLLSYTFAQILADEASGTFTIGAEEVTNLSTFVTNMKSAINSYLSSKSVASAANATNSTYASKIGTSNTHPSVGNTTTPVYVNSNGTVTACNKYAGGTAVTLNGTSKAANTASFYAPETLGSTNTYLKSTGSGFDWVSISAPVGNNVSRGSTLSLYLNPAGAQIQDKFKSYLLVPKKGGYILVKQYYQYRTPGDITTKTQTVLTQFYGPVLININVSWDKGTGSGSYNAYIKNVLSYGTTISNLSQTEAGKIIEQTNLSNYIDITAMDAGFTYYDYTQD
jgi:hypothetical protein